MGALTRRNKEKAAICATELAEVRRLVNFLTNVQLAIERVIMRLETIIELSDIVVDLKPALRLLQNISSELFQVLPDVSSELNNVNDAIRDTLHVTRLQTDVSQIPSAKKTDAGAEILKEVSYYIEKKLAETLPEPPETIPVKAKTPIKELIALSASSSEMLGNKTEEKLDSSQTVISYKKSEIKEITMKVKQPSLEDVLLEYVRKSKGEIDMSRCSNELKTSNEEIERALENLGTQGKIKIELKSPE